MYAVRYPSTVTFSFVRSGVVNEETRMEMENPSNGAPIRKKRFVTVGKQ